jgi:microcin C transport system permease protein
MTVYFLRRLLLMVPTFLGVTLIAFLITRLVPGGPLERAIMEMKMGSGGRGSVAVTNIPDDLLDELRKEYGLDKGPVEAYFLWLGKVVRLDFGKSSYFREPVIGVIVQRFPVSMYFGLLGYLISYLLSIPLGIAKAIKHGSNFDFASSAIVFIGYSIPGWAMGTVLLVLLAGGQFWQVFPLGGFRSTGFDSLPAAARSGVDPASVQDENGRFDWSKLPFYSKVIDQGHHTALPVFCYVIGSFASLTVLTKNSLLENIGQDYVRTAFAKGLSPTRVIYLHTLRNSLIPVATGLGHVLGLVMAGSFLIETVFNIDGMGLLGYQSILRRDYAVVMGTLSIGILLTMLGNILSDVLYAIIDPRIRFE